MYHILYKGNSIPGDVKPDSDISNNNVYQFSNSLVMVAELKHGELSQNC